MAERPVFMPRPNAAGQELVEALPVQFTWHPGMAPSQKMKNVSALHVAAAERGIRRVLEVSTKSSQPMGKRLSAFNLILTSKEHGELTVESAFQGSKVFAEGGPYRDLFGLSGREIRRDERLGSGLVAFQFEGPPWDLEPKTAFYDWLYIRALHAHGNLRERVLEHAGFTDIEFNPKKSLNCQARSCALYVALTQAGTLDAVLADRGLYLKTVSSNPGRVF